jgi:high-affinity Fe2+/Pb2+ permease
MSDTGKRLQKHLLLIIMLIIIYLAIVLAFLLTYGLTKNLGVIPCVFLSFAAGFAVVVLGARGFWRLAETLSERKAVAP